MFTSKGVLLTRATEEARGDFSAIALDKIKLTTIYGTHIEFDYAMYGGSSPKGDGLSFFIYDANEDFHVGSHGAGLGYAPRLTDAGLEGYIKQGLAGAYLGIGFDAYTDFKFNLNLASERREGIPVDLKDNFEAQFSFISLRGGAYKDANGYDVYKGYPVIYSQLFDEYASIGSKSTVAELNGGDGSYLFSQKGNSYDFAMITENSDQNAENNTLSYNRVILDLIPKVVGNSVHVLITLKVKHSHGTTTVLENYEYKGSYKTYDIYGNLYDFDVSMPSLFSIGFAGGTGGYYQGQVIRDVLVSLPYFPETREDVVTICTSSNMVAQLDPFINDDVYTGPIANPWSGNGNDVINYGSFRFEDERGNNLASSFSGDILTYNQPNIGTWKYNKSTGKVTVDLVNNSSMVPGNENIQIYYSIKGLANGGPFDDENYRSEPTKLKVLLKQCQRYIMVNPHLPIRKQ